MIAEYIVAMTAESIAGYWIRRRFRSPRIDKTALILDTAVVKPHTHYFDSGHAHVRFHLNKKLGLKCVGCNEWLTVDTK